MVAKCPSVQPASKFVVACLSTQKPSGDAQPFKPNSLEDEEGRKTSRR